jgi:hypothetical protein
MKEICFFMHSFVSSSGWMKVIFVCSEICIPTSSGSGTRKKNRTKAQANTTKPIVMRRYYQRSPKKFVIKKEAS